LTNLLPAQVKPNNAALAEKVGRILLVDAYHLIDNRIACCKRLRDSLKPGGEVAIIDFAVVSPLGPHKDDRISATEVAEEMKSAHHAKVVQHGFLPCQFFLAFHFRP
jgi:hypothetical protein